MRGGGPAKHNHESKKQKSSPHARGWSGDTAFQVEHVHVFPACAGVVLPIATRLPSLVGLPRMRGGGPNHRLASPRRRPSSPHARGWSHFVINRRPGHIVFPACAGVVPHPNDPPTHQHRLPRMRGGGPHHRRYNKRIAMSSPHARGWSRTRPEPDPGGRSSPHARGWSWCHRVLTCDQPVFPACAGVVRSATMSESLKPSLPRMRGGGPRRRSVRQRAGQSSPHARGWSPDRWRADRCGPVFPACAGVVLLGIGQNELFRSLPRMRGGGPSVAPDRFPRVTSSPHARGWSCSTAAG